MANNAGTGDRAGSKPNGTNGVHAEPVDNASDSPGRNIGGIPVERIESGSGSTGKRRGRPPGSRTGSGSGSTSGSTAKTPPRGNDLDVIAGAFMGVHDIAAHLLSLDELSIDEDEAKILAKAVQRLQAYYPAIDVPGQALAWIGLFAACGRIYGPRVVAVKARMKTEKEKAARPVPVPSVIYPDNFSR
jgi:hypothetical protein